MSATTDSPAMTPERAADRPRAAAAEGFESSYGLELMRNKAEVREIPELVSTTCKNPSRSREWPSFACLHRATAREAARPSSTSPVQAILR